MTITFNSTIKHPAPGKGKPGKEKDLKTILNRLIEEEKVKCDSVKWVDENSVEILGNPNLAIHSLMLQAEELGKEVIYEKKTVIKIV